MARSCDRELLIEYPGASDRFAPAVRGSWLPTASMLNDLDPAGLWSRSGTSLLLGALNTLGALDGLLALSSPRRARPEPYPTVSMWSGCTRPHHCSGGDRGAGAG